MNERINFKMHFRQFINTLLIIGLILTSNPLKAQIDYSFNGYITEMPSYGWMQFGSFIDEELTDNLIHNRLNFKVTPIKNLDVALEVRSRLISGQTVKFINNGGFGLMSNYAGMIDFDPGLADMSFNLASSNSYVLNTTIDRFWTEYIIQSFQIRVGRQRVNWGQSLIWNPNDIFNAYSYFDFDYTEKPGIDGIRCQLYTGTASLLEGVFKIDHYNTITTALRYRFNTLSYDFQFIGGYYNEQEYVLGGGWSGNIINAGFYGECSWFIPKYNDQPQTIISTVGGNYTFGNSLFLQAEVLYSSNLKNSSNFLNFYYNDGSVKNLSMTEWTLLVSTSYPFTPLLIASFSLMSFPSMDSYYFGPSIDYSLSDNLSLSAITQVFTGNPDGMNFNNFNGFIRLKWNF